jgi:Mrp family chromosome partitioning ATPase
MKLIEDNLAHGDLPTVAGARAHKVAPSGAPESLTPGQPLQIEYSTTQVMAEALQRLQGQPGVVAQDRSPLAESFKMLRNQVMQRMRSSGHKVLAVTSARAFPGKSLTALNLAMTIAADLDSAVLLVDADLTGRGLQEMFGLLGARGLSDHLKEGVPIPDLLINPGLPRFVLLPAGQQPTLNSAELLGTRQAQRLIQDMKMRYQDRYMVVDLPAVLDTADALAFLPFVDTTLVVVEDHTTALQDMQEMNKLLAPFHLIGSVLSPERPAVRDTAKPARRRSWYRR